MATATAFDRLAELDRTTVLLDNDLILGGRPSDRTDRTRRQQIAEDGLPYHLAHAPRSEHPEPEQLVDPSMVIGGLKTAI